MAKAALNPLFGRDLSGDAIEAMLALLGGVGPAAVYAPCIGISISTPPGGQAVRPPKNQARRARCQSTTARQARLVQDLEAIHSTVVARAVYSRDERQLEGGFKEHTDAAQAARASAGGSRRQDGNADSERLPLDFKCLDMYTKKLWCRALKSKDGPDVRRGIKSILDEIKAKGYQRAGYSDGQWV